MSADRPRLLFVSPRFLFPMDQGGKIRTGNILRGLKGGAFSVTLASPAPADHARHAADIASACNCFLHWPERPTSHLRRLLALCSRLPVAAVSDRSAAGRAVVRAGLLQQPDIVVVDFPHAEVLMPASSVLSEPKSVPHGRVTRSVLFTHNVEAEIFERHAARSRGLHRWVWQAQSRKMRRLEAQSLGRRDTVIAVSARDQAALRQRYQHPAVRAIDTGVDLDFFAMSPPQATAHPGADGGTIVFTATMSWPANVDGIHFLLDEVFPLLLRARPAIRAVIIGRNPPAALAEKIRDRGVNVVLTGFVEDIRPYVALANVYVIPLFVGSGTRIKAFEAMAMGRPVVSTTLGVEGLEVEDGTHYLCADAAADFAQAVLRLLDDAALGHRLAGAARRLMEDRFSWNRVARQFEAICLQTLAQREMPAGSAVPDSERAAAETAVSA